MSLDETIKSIKQILQNFAAMYQYEHEWVIIVGHEPVFVTLKHLYQFVNRQR